jgi:hypothetical protein
LLQEGEEEVQVFADEEGDFLLGGAVVGFGGGGDVAGFESGFWGGVALELLVEDVLEDETAVVPDCVVFWVPGEEAGG